MHRPLILLTALLGLSACAAFESPRRADGYHCSPSSAIRQRGAATEAMVAVRPAPRFGSCKS